MTPATRPAWQKSIITLSAVVTTAVILSMLYIGRVVLIPIAMAIFLTFVLSPVVVYLQRRGLARMPAVLLTVATAIGLFLGTTFLITRELASLSTTLAANTESIKAKVASVRSLLIDSTDSPLTLLMDDIDKVINPKKAEPGTTVVMEPRQSSWTPSVGAILGPVTEAFGQAAFSFILVVFMLLAKTDLGDRLFRLLGENQMTVATRAMSDASDRVSRYLFRQFVVNFSFGLIVAAILFAIGLKYSLLWGFLIFLMRYVPYIGTWLGIIPPVLFAIATGPDWVLPLATGGVIVGLELIVNNFLEPYLYGKSHGISEVAQLVSAAIWSFLWGPIGLILSGPITTCLLVLGRHAPPFRFLEILLGSQPALSPASALFQRLASKDQDEALRTLQKSFKDRDTLAVFDDVFFPALAQLKASRLAGQIDAEDDVAVTAVAREVLDDTLEDIRLAPRGDEKLVDRVRVLASPAQDELDRLSLDAMTSQLQAANWEVRVSSVTTLTAELLADAAAFDPQVIVIGSLPPGGVAHARYLAKRLRQRFPEAHLLIGRWNDGELNAAEWKAAGCDAATASVREALKHLEAWRPTFQTRDAKSPVAPVALES